MYSVPLKPSPYAAAVMNDEMRARVAASRAAQGLPPVVEDLAVIERVAAVFRLVDDPESPAVPEVAA